MQFWTDHSQAILSTLLGVSEIIGLWAGKGGILALVISGLKSFGAKEPSEM